MAIESKNLLVWVKAMSRGNALPLDASEVYESLAAAEAYAGTATAYAGQTIKALLADGKYHSYTLQPSESGYVLDEVGALKASDLKQFVQIVNALPTSGQEQGVLYIHEWLEGIENPDPDGEPTIEVERREGYIWDGSQYVKVFYDVSVVDGIEDRVDALEGDVSTLEATKAPIHNPIFTGSAKLKIATGETEYNDELGEEVPVYVDEELAVKSYVDGMIANLKSDTPDLLTADSYSKIFSIHSGDTYRVAESGKYFGHNCEAGDLIIVLQNEIRDPEEASGPLIGSFEESDLKDMVMVVQANIDGAVTSSANAATVGDIVVFDAVTGKIIKSSGVNISSLNDAIAKAHSHANATQLATYDKTQTELLAAAKSEAQGLVTAHETAVNTALDGKADKATTLAGYNISDAYTKTEIDNKLSPITENLNTKITATEAESKIATAKGEAIEAAQDLVDAHADAVTEALKGKADNATTLAGYGITDAYTKTEVGNLIATSESGTDTKINNAKTAVLADAKSYTDTTLSNRVGAIPADTNIKSYIDTAVGAGGTASAEAIATAKQEAINSSKSYTDTAIGNALTVVEF